MKNKILFYSIEKYRETMKCIYKISINEYTLDEIQINIQNEGQENLQKRKNRRKDGKRENDRRVCKRKNRRVLC